jgi:DNA polymerase V
MYFKINSNDRYVLFDCNQFYVSCERAFAPYLERQPVGVLSNNDGCLVALSTELKALGINRGTPSFQIREIVKGHKVHLFSSNYELYGDMSSRVMRIVASMSDDIEIYSIDEAFLLFQDMHSSFSVFDHARAIRKRVKKETSIPISVGIARTKTLAKIANMIAKKSKEDIFELHDTFQTEAILKKVAVGDIWGIGRQHTKRLNRYGIYTAYDFMTAPTYQIRKEMSINGERTQLELRGIPCLDMKSTISSPKSIICSRSFGKPVSNLSEMLESISLYASKAVKNLRKKNSVAKTITVFITTNPFKDTRQYANVIHGSLPDYSAYTPDFINLATTLMQKIFRENYQYKKSGVMLTDMIPQNRIYPSLFSIPYGADKRHSIMQVVDKVNEQYGKEKIFFASNGIKNSWQMRREMTSPRYTTRWDELLVVGGETRAKKTENISAYTHFK